MLRIARLQGLLCQELQMGETLLLYHSGTAAGRVCVTVQQHLLVCVIDPLSLTFYFTGA